MEPIDPGVTGEDPRELAERCSHGEVRPRVEVPHAPWVGIAHRTAVDARELSPGELTAAIERFTGLAASAHALSCLLLAVAEDSGLVTGDGCRDGAAWAVGRLSVALPTGRRMAAAGRAMLEHPALAAAACAGALSADQVAPTVGLAALAVARSQRQLDAALADLALDGDGDGDEVGAVVAQLSEADLRWNHEVRVQDRVAALVAKAASLTPAALARELADATERAPGPADAAARHDARRARFSARAGGMGRLVLDAPAEELAGARAAVEAVVARDPWAVGSAQEPEGPRPSAEQRRADAALGLLTHPADRPDATPAQKTMVVIHVPESALHQPGCPGAGQDPTPGGPTRPELTSHTAGQPPTALAHETIKRLLCDGLRQTLIRGADHQIISLTDAMRTVPDWLHRELLRRDQHCRWPGCSTRRGLHAHHIRHWLHHGPTRGPNLAMLCSFHHHLAHEGGWDVAWHDPHDPTKGLLALPPGRTRPLGLPPPGINPTDARRLGLDHTTDHTTDHAIWS